VLQETAYAPMTMNLIVGPVAARKVSIVATEAGGRLMDAKFFLNILVFAEQAASLPSKSLHQVAESIDGLREV
jgi:hypothetical protein